MHPLIGHHTERDRILRSIKADQLPQTILLTGPQGVGKQRFGLWVAQALLCEASAEPPCGLCRSCLQVLALGHPDLHWFMPVIRPKASEPDKQVQEIAEAMGEVVEERRREPLYQPQEGLAGHFVATARLLQKRAALTPAQGRRKVFLVAEAERLVPQESSPEAANALLKLLEEPSPDSQFILTSVDANRLLPTIRSRLVQLRLGRLRDAEVEGFLADYAGLGGADLRLRVASAGGSIGRALALGDDQARANRAAEDLVKIFTGSIEARAERVLKQGAWAARGDFAAMLDALAESLGEAARAASGLAARRPVPDVFTRGRTVGALLAAQQRVTEAREAAQGNVNPQLLLAVLVDELAEVL
jgi:DNA polymerase-3 subunit delta'